MVGVVGAQEGGQLPDVIKTPGEPEATAPFRSQEGDQVQESDVDTNSQGDEEQLPCHGGVSMFT